jgi:hypothetical protein
MVREENGGNLRDISPLPSSNSRYFTNPGNRLAPVVTRYTYSTCLEMSGSRKNSHELVQARINVASTILDLLFSTQVRELYAGVAE